MSAVVITTSDRLEERGVERGSARRSSLNERTREREGRHQSDERWNRFKSNIGETSEKRGEERTVWAFTERTDTIWKFE